MPIAIKGYYEKGQIIMEEDAPVHTRTEVIITFLTAEKHQSEGKRIPGALKGKVSIPDDFNEPLDDLKDHM
ncbi:DUF2281 domain-containing protein [Hufsiella ginkgonis]|uniref:DUF2281 domain-containing protein n=1 Tax=Hufsiella ginkgonis TaxID=2695274 RepID=A0A7K1Y0E0_9SPHI|nr:DUF2281 domain-containing protein [Hufsiella ginkgonis]MXV16547.1 DUF2281 domain-containing protein [Hufsiella ginkgonis]